MSPYARIYRPPFCQLQVVLVLRGWELQAIVNVGGVTRQAGWRNAISLARVVGAHRGASLRIGQFWIAVGLSK